MENINAVIVIASIAMVVGVFLFVRFYNARYLNTQLLDDETIENDVFVHLDVHNSPAPGIIPDYPVPVIVDEDCDCAPDCTVCYEPVEVVTYEMIKINSIHRIKEKSRQYLMDSEANYTKKQADAILADLDVAFTSEGLDLTKAPFEYTVQ